MPANLTEIVQREVADYHGPALRATPHYFEDAQNQKYAVIIVPEYESPRKSKSSVVVMARVVGEKVIIDEDLTDRPLWEELVRARASKITASPRTRWARRTPAR